MASSTTRSLWAVAQESKASDLHAVTDQHAVLRVDGTLRRVSKEPLTGAEVHALLSECLSTEQIERLTAEGSLECAHELANGERLRISAYVVSGNPGFSARLIPTAIPTLEQIRMPEAVLELCRLRHGLVIFTGPSGCGKSTSMAAILAALAKAFPLHIVTLEDPIEYRYPHGLSLVSQRELGSDFHSFGTELSKLLRQDADVVMVGEMRDLESMRHAISLAETGHLVFTTLHTADTIQTVDRVVASFPADEQPLARNRLAATLSAVVAQRLLPSTRGGRVANREILVRTAAVSNMIRENRTAELRNVLETNADVGMTTFARDFQNLVAQGLVMRPG